MSYLKKERMRSMLSLKRGRRLVLFTFRKYCQRSFKSIINALDETEDDALFDEDEDSDELIQRIFILMYQ